MKISFISGHTNLTEQEFNDHYKNAIDKSIAEENKFVLGNASGADTMALKYLVSKGVDKKNITIYVYDRFGRDIGKKYEDDGFHTVKGFNSYTHRDGQMTNDSTHDILWIRPPDEMKQLLGTGYNKNRITGTEKNFIRRLTNKGIFLNL